MSDTQNVEQLAEDLHREYRAAEKALRTTDVAGEKPYLQHDHGWAGCHRKKYFLNRATRQRRESFATGGVIPQGKYAPVGEHTTDAADYLPKGFTELIASKFQVPLRFIIGPSDAQQKAKRDALVRKTLWPEQKYTLTNAIAGPQTGRGVRV